MGHEITQEELDASMKQHDIEKNDKITKDEFKALFLDTSDLSYAKQFTLASDTPSAGETVGRWKIKCFLWTFPIKATN